MKNPILISKIFITKSNTPTLSALSKITPIMLSAMACLNIVACQSTSMMSSQLTQQDKLIHAKKAKTELEQSINKQLRSSFNYQSSTNFSNGHRRQALKNATPQQLANADDVKNHCDNSHDNGYVELLRKAQKTGNDIEDSQYDTQKIDIMKDYQACKKHYDQWYDSYYYGDNEKKYLPLGMNSYDEDHTSKDVKKANRHHAYLYNPLEIGMSGTYQPLSGKFGVMPSVKYQSRNLFASTQQPIFIDLKAGEIYFWADSLAYLNSELLDDKLGTSWHNKWISFSIKDESLPKGFGKSFIKAYLKAMKTAYQYEPATDFSYVSSEQLAGQLAYLSQQQQQIIHDIKTNHIISQKQTADVKAHQGYLFNKILYNSISQQYPQLFRPTNGESNKFSEQLKEGKISKLFITAYFNRTHSLVKEYENEHEDVSQTKGINNGYDDNGFIIVNFTNDSPIQSVSNYGMKGKKIAWIHQRNYLSKNLLMLNNIESTMIDESMMMDTLTTFSAVKNTPFEKLPSASMPNSSNSIDAKAYGEELMAYYESGNGTSLGKIFYEVYAQYKQNKQTKSEVSATEAEEVKALETLTDVDADNQSDNNTDTKNKATYESIQCVMMSVNLEMMCSEDDGFDQKDTAELAVCQSEKIELQSAYEHFCQ